VTCLRTGEPTPEEMFLYVTNTKWHSSMSANITRLRGMQLFFEKIEGFAKKN
jgi:hypothetical protein